MRRWLMGVMAAVVLGVAAQSACGPPTAAPPNLLWGVTVDGYPVTPALLDRLETEIPLRYHLVVFFLQWPAPGNSGPFPRQSLDAIWQRGGLPCITWEPFYFSDGKETAVTLEELLGGACDRYLRKFASEAAAWQQPVIIRLAHEMNLARYHWGGPPEAYGPRSPEAYRTLFRYVKTLFDAAGAGNVIWAFCPNAESIPNPEFAPVAPWNRAGAYYPGHDAVDILGMDGYNWGTTQTRETHGWESRWRSFQDIFGPLYLELRALAPEKPIMVFETASARQGGNRAQWVAEMADTASRWRLLGLSWFHADKEIDWRLGGGDTGAGARYDAAPAGAGQQWARRFLQTRP